MGNLTPNRERHTPFARDRVDWPAIRDQIDLCVVAVELLGQPHARHGDGGRRLWWRWPFHPDRNPSFYAPPGRRHWKCFGCGQHGDAELVMRIQRCPFPEAKRRLAELVGMAPGTGASTASHAAAPTQQPLNQRPAPDPGRQSAQLHPPPGFHGIIAGPHTSNHVDCPPPTRRRW
jgi:hypothetical protein